MTIVPNFLCLVALVFGRATANNFVPLALGPDFNYPISADDILRGYKINTAEGETPFKGHIFTGEVSPIAYTDTFGKSAVIKSTNELTEMLEISGSLSVSYGPAISGEGSGSYLNNKVASKRQATILYRTRRAAYARAVNVATLQPLQGFTALSPSALADVYGTKFIDRIVYGAQLDVLFTVTASEDIDLQEIEAELRGKIGVGPLSVSFEAKFSQTTGSAQSAYTMTIEASATGVDFSVPPNPTFNQTNDLINDFNAKYDELRTAVSDGETVDLEKNVLNQLSPVGFTLSSIADYTTALNELEVAALDSKMQDLRSVFYSALFTKAQLIVAAETQAAIYSDPRERDEIFDPYSQIKDIVVTNLDAKIDECLVFRRQPFERIVGRDGTDVAVVPEIYPKTEQDNAMLEGLKGDAYLASPVTLGTSRFQGYHYVGFALPMAEPGPNGFLAPWMSGSIRRDSDNEVVAYAKTPEELELIAYAAIYDIERQEPDYVRYGEKLHFQVMSRDNRWLSGGRSGRGEVITRDKLQDDYELSDNVRITYEWIVHSNPNTIVNEEEEEEERDGHCVRYGDKIYLKVNTNSPAWLAGINAPLLSATGETVKTLNVFQSDQQAQLAKYQWIVRSNLGSGVRDDAQTSDAAFGECVQAKSVVFLQNNHQDNRWLSGGRGSGNEEVVTRNALESDYEVNDAPTTYQWMVRRSSGSGIRGQGFYCSAVSASGNWVPIDGSSVSTAALRTQTVRFTQGLASRDESSGAAEWTPSESWERSILTSVTGGFRFGTDGLDVTWLEGAELSSSVQSALDADPTIPQSTPVAASGQAWQFVYTIRDICDPDWELRTNDIVVTTSVNEQPCCLPGFELDPNQAHGPCRRLSPCQCGASVCELEEIKFELPKSIQSSGDDGDASDGGSQGGGDDGSGVHGVAASAAFSTLLLLLSSMAAVI